MNFLENVFNFIFPPTCGICGKIGDTYLCEQCRNELTNSNIFLNQLDYFKIEQNNPIDEHFYIFLYDGIIREKILQYKFHNKPYLSNTFSEFFVKNKKVCGFLKKYDIMSAVPISVLRKRQRGYNQSELIARKISKIGLITFENDLLEKIKDNKPQSALDKRQRLENVKNVYKIENELKIKEKRILLFDDIYTTGATAKECAKSLKQAGAKKVGILTIAKDFQKVN